jgi:predicted transcriptional regulator
MSIGALAALSGVCQAQVSQYERGLIHLGERQKRRLAGALRAARQAQANSKAPIDWSRFREARRLVQVK